jgi:antirestriction protein ArdC
MFSKFSSIRKLPQKPKIAQSQFMMHKSNGFNRTNNKNADDKKRMTFTAKFKEKSDFPVTSKHLTNFSTIRSDMHSKNLKEKRHQSAKTRDAAASEVTAAQTEKSIGIVILRFSLYY